MDFLFRHLRSDDVSFQHFREHHVRGPGEEIHKRLHDEGQELKRPHHFAGRVLRRNLTQTLREELAHHDREVGNQHHGEEEGKAGCHRGRHSEVFKRRADRAGERRLADHTGHEADDRDADLNRGQRGSRIIHHAENLLRHSVTIIRARLKPGTAAGNQGRLTHGEKAVEDNECAEHQQTDYRCHKRLSSFLNSCVIRENNADYVSFRVKFH